MQVEQENFHIYKPSGLFVAQTTQPWLLLEAIINLQLFNSLVAVVDTAIIIAITVYKQKNMLKNNLRRTFCLSLRRNFKLTVESLDDSLRVRCAYDQKYCIVQASLNSLDHPCADLNKAKLTIKNRNSSSKRNVGSHMESNKSWQRRVGVRNASYNKVARNS